MLRAIAILVLLLATMALGRPDAQAATAGKCTSLEARCAVKIGGRCDPATGHWEYGYNGAPGNTKLTQAYNACISEGLKRK
ncbi:MAG TPA: hypothetical protein VK438_14425 [Xanthobacteraceae bacterium]|nr:hypothetical protein [Xanthobacteraceae bacterium]